jgi:phospholipase/carboxylesterase
MDAWIGRRSFLMAGASLLLPTLSACGISDPVPLSGAHRLSARPGPPSLPAPIGESALGLATGRDGLLFVPASYDPGTPLPLYVFLHGATADAESGRPFAYLADDMDVIVLIPESRAVTWDFVLGRYGPDVAFVDQALQHTFDRCAVDSTRIVLAGHSDGATYALSLGATNGDLFSHLIGHSPGGMDRQQLVGRPRVFVSHGSSDMILPVTISRNDIVPDLEALGYLVEYLEYDGGHGLPRAVAEAAAAWFLT